MRTGPSDLCKGVTVTAPGVYFTAPDSECTGVAFCTQARDDSDQAPVMIEGAEDPDGGVVAIGVPPDDGGGLFEFAIVDMPPTIPQQQPSCNFCWPNCRGCRPPDGGQYGSPLPVRISHAWVNGHSIGIAAIGTDVTLGPLAVHVGGVMPVDGAGGAACRAMAMHARRLIRAPEHSYSVVADVQAIFSSAAVARRGFRRRRDLSRIGPGAQEEEQHGCGGDDGERGDG